MSTLNLTIIQTQLYWEDKEANLDMLSQKIKSITEYTEVIILPEMFNTGFSMQPEKFAETMEGPSIDWMRRLAEEEERYLLVHLLLWKVVNIIIDWFGCFLMDKWVITTKDICLPLQEKTNIIPLETKD